VRALKVQTRNPKVDAALVTEQRSPGGMLQLVQVNAKVSG
jgi:hypothetical protein